MDRKKIKNYPGKLIDFRFVYYYIYLSNRQKNNLPQEKILTENIEESIKKQLEEGSLKKMFSLIFNILVLILLVTDIS